MKQNKNTLVLAFVAIGVCAVIYGGWYFYRQSVANEQSPAPPPSGIPDILHATPGAPPIQPH
jgi:hypothetical protein